MSKKNVLGVVLCCIFGILTVPAKAATIYWTGSQGNGNWSTVNAGASNWSTDAAGTTNYAQAPQNGDDLNFNATNATILTTTNDMVGLIVNSVTFVNASFTNAVTINGNSFTISPSAATVGITNANATAGRNVTINAPIVVGAAQTWTATTTNAITILNGNLAGSANVTVAGNGSNNTTFPNIRLGGSNSSFTGTLDSSAGSSGVLLSAPAAMTGGLINVNGNNANLWLTANSAASPYTMGLNNTAGSPNVITRNAGTSGIYMTGGDVFWDPGNGGDYVWSNNTNTELRINGSNDASPHMLNFGNSTGKLILSGGNRAIAGGTGGNNPGRVNLLFALADDAQATARVFSATVNLLILNRAAVNNVTGATKSSITIGTGTSGSVGMLAISDEAQLFSGNLNISTGTLLIDGINGLNWSSFATTRSMGTGNRQFQLTSSGGFAARTLDLTVDSTGGLTASTFDRTLTLGSAVLANDGTVYANRTVTISRDTIYSTRRTITGGASGPGLTGAAGTGTVQKVTGALSDSGAGTSRGALNFTSSGTVADNAIPEIVLSGANSMTGSAFGTINSNFINTGPGGMLITDVDVLVRFDGDASLPTGTGGNNSYMWVCRRNTTPNRSGYMITGSLTGQTYDLAANQKFVFAALGNSEINSTFGSTSGLATFQNSAIVLGLPRSTNILVRDGTLTLGSGVGPITFQAGATSSQADTTIQGAANTITDDATVTRALIKRGVGTLVLNNVAYTLPVAGTDNAANVTWTLGTATSGVFDGSVQETGSASNNSMSAVKATLQGGVIEFAASPRALTLGTGIGQLGMNTATGGGFAATGADRTVNITNGALTWATSPFIAANGSLYFGSLTADSTVDFQNNISLNAGTRTILLVKGISSTAPEGKLSGVISGTSASNLVVNAAKHPNGSFLNPGSLLLTGANSYQGTTTINAGRLLIGIDAPLSVNGALGNAASSVLLGNTSGSLDAALLTQGAFSVGRPIAVQAGNTGTMTVGGNSANISSFTGAITLNKDLVMTAVSGGMVNVTGAISGSGAITKTGVGTVVMTNTNSFSGVTSVSAGMLAGTATLSSSGVTVNSGAALAPGTPGGATGTFTAVSADFSAGGKLQVRITNSANDMLQVTGTGANTLNMGGGQLVVDLTGFNNSAVPNVAIVVAQGPTWSATGFTTLTLIPGNFPATVRYVNNGSGSTTSKQVVIALNGNVSPVKVADFTARADALGAVVSWTAVSEYQNAGFNIYRRALESPDWVKVNPALICGRITNPDEKIYSYFDWAPAGMYEYQLASVDLSGAREMYEKPTDPVEVDSMSDHSDVTEATVEAAVCSIDMAMGAQTAQRAESLFAKRRTKHAIPACEADNRSIAVREISAGPDFERGHSNKYDGPQVHLGIRWFSSSQIGLSARYSAAKVCYKDAGVLLIPQAAMPAGYNLNQVAIQREGRNITSLAKVPNGLLVYAPGYQDDYTDKDAIFLRTTSNPTAVGRVSAATGLFSSYMPANVSSPNNIMTPFHDVYFDYNNSFRPFVFEPWFSSQYLTQGSTQNFTVTLPDVVNAPATMVVTVWSLTSNDSVSPDHSMQMLINGLVVGEASWDGGGRMLQLAFTVPAGALKTGDNVVSLITPTLTGLDSQIAFLHSISVSYMRGLDASESIAITHATNTAGLYELYNVPAAGAWVVDARFVDRAALVPTETQVQADGTLRVRFIAAAGGSGKYLVVPVGQENQPLSIRPRQVKPLKLSGNYLATGPAQFGPGVQPLLQKRAKEGIRSVFVDQEQLFDYYNYGRYGPEGIRNAVRALRPSYLLLVGRTTYDYLNYGGANVDPLCPAFLVSTNFWAQTTSDSAFGDLGRGYPEVAVGRLPINNTSELAGAVSHIVNYKGIPASGARLHAVADKTDPLVANFGAQLDVMLEANHPDIFWQENYLEKTYATAPEVTAAMKYAANGGADLILYSGHGNAARLGADAPRILDQTSVQEWTGNTIFIQATCTATWMAKNESDYRSIAIQALTQSQGGISASIGTSTYMNPDAAVAFMNQLLRNVNGTGTRWGTALLKTQQWAGTQTGNAFYKDLMTTEQLFGDPAMPVYAPKLLAPPPSTAGTF